MYQSQNYGYSQNSQFLQQPTLPPQQILTARGKASIDKLRMSPNSSILIADETAPIVWKCTSDGLGNVTAEPYDISPHKTEEQIQQENIFTMLAAINQRLDRLEGTYEQSTTQRNATTEQHPTEYRTNQTNVGNAQKRGKSSGNAQSNDAEQS